MNLIKGKKKFNQLLALLHFSTDLPGWEIRVTSSSDIECHMAIPNDNRNMNAWPETVVGAFHASVTLLAEFPWNLSFEDEKEIQVPTLKNFLGTFCIPKQISSWISKRFSTPRDKTIGKRVVKMQIAFSGSRAKSKCVESAHITANCRFTLDRNAFLPRPFAVRVRGGEVTRNNKAPSCTTFRTVWSAIWLLYEGFNWILQLVFYHSPLASAFRVGLVHVNRFL